MLEKIEKQIKIYIYQVLEAKDRGKSIDNENPKLDFKRKWYDLKNLSEINEFLKDTTAIANTVGLDGYIVIGFDDKKGEFFNSYFEDSNLRDTSDLNGIIAKRCSNLFDIIAYPIEIDTHKLSVLHIPPTLEKPILITNYQKTNKDGSTKDEQHRIFVRQGTSTKIATKYDLEMMFYDRKNIQPDYELELDIVKIQFSEYPVNSGIRINNAFELIIYFNYENLGRKSISIHNLVLTFKTTSFSEQSSFFRGGENWVKGEVKRTGDYRFVYHYDEDKNFLSESFHRKDIELSLQIEMSNGKQIFKTFDFIPPYSS